MINRLSNPINRNRSAAKILKVMSSTTHLYTSWKIPIMASQAHCTATRCKLCSKGWPSRSGLKLPKKSNIGISGDFNAILRRFLWRLPRADNSYEKKRAILWGLPMNSMHRWCKRKRLKSGGGTAILCKEDSSSNIFRACTFGWLDSNQPKPTQHWTRTMICFAHPLAPTKTPKARCRQSSSPIHICLVLVGFLRFISYPFLQPSYHMSPEEPSNGKKDTHHLLNEMKI